MTDEKIDRLLNALGNTLRELSDNDSKLPIYSECLSSLLRNVVRKWLTADNKPTDNHWIRVEDRLPEPGVWVQTWTGHDVLSGYLHRSEVERKLFGMWNILGPEGEQAESPSYWQPLPAPPGTLAATSSSPSRWLPDLATAA
jgi:hypothetical protein